MTMAAAMESRTAEAPARSKSGSIAQIDVITDLASAEAAWRNLEARDQLVTGYQRFDLLNLWQREVGARDAATPLILIARDAEHRPLLLLPLALKRNHGV